MAWVPVAQAVTGELFGPFKLYLIEIWPDNKLIREEGTNIFDLFKYQNVIITSTSAKKIQERVLNEKN